MINLRNALTTFRDALHSQPEAPAPSLATLLQKQKSRQARATAWTAAGILTAVSVVILGVTIDRSEPKAVAPAVDAQLIEQVNAGLSRPVPRALSPLLRVPRQNNN